jgi:hypothetical protein
MRRPAGSDPFWRVGALAALLLLLAPVAAEAATVWTGSAGQMRQLVVRAASGERNDVTISGPVGGELVVEDAGAPPVAAEGCRQDGPGRVACPAADLLRITVVLGDGDDAARFALTSAMGALPTAEVLGGPGDDVLQTGPEGQQNLDGGEGDDRLTKTGTTGSTFRGGPGDDVIRTVDAQATLGGVPPLSEGDEVACDDGHDSVEADGIDRLQACEAVTWASPPVSAPRDRRRGGSGGDGDEGRGEDTGAGGRGTTARPVLTAKLGGALVASPAGVTRIKVACDNGDAPCRNATVVLRLATSGRTARPAAAVVLGRARATIPAGRTRTVRVRLNARGRRLLRQRKRLRARLTLTAAGRTASRTVTIRRRAG